MTSEIQTTAPKAIQSADDFTPRSLGEALRLAELLANSTLVPNEFRGNPGNVFVGMTMAKELGIPVLQGLNNICIINGRAAIFGDLGKALLLRAGFKIEEDSIEIMRVTKRGRCKITRPDGQVMEKNFSWEDAKLGGLLDSTPAWRKTPYDMLGWKAFWRCARGIGSDVLKGMQGAEEIQDLPDQTSRFAAAQRDAPQLPAPAKSTEEMKADIERGMEPIAEAKARLMGEEPSPEERGDPDTEQADAPSGEPKSTDDGGKPAPPDQDASLFAAGGDGVISAGSLKVGDKIALAPAVKSLYPVHLGIIGGCKTFEQLDNEAYSISLDKSLSNEDREKLTKAISIKRQTVKS